MADTTTPQTPAPFDGDALRANIRQEVRGALGEFAQQAQQQQAQRAQATQNQNVQAAQAQDPIYNAVVKPYVEPLARQVAVQSQGALDGVRFYAQHPEAVRHMDALEGQFNQMAAQGIPFDRQTIYNHYRGQNFDHFVKEHQEAVNRTAAQGANVGPGSMGRPDTSAFSMDEFVRLTPEERKKRIENVTF